MRKRLITFVLVMRKRLITFVLVGFVLWVVYDLVFQERPGKLQIDGSPLSGAQLDAKLQVKGVKCACFVSRTST
jgi:hypothetical protein